ncbi:MAG: hypothetical protein ACO1Q7_05855, partial [Gemmatimonas sp.]
VSLGAMVYWCFFQQHEFPSFVAWLAVLLLSADYVARVMRAHTTEQPHPWPDLVPLLVMLYAWGSVAYLKQPSAIFGVLAVWLPLRYAYTLARIVMSWRHHWVWVNDRRAANS